MSGSIYKGDNPKIEDCKFYGYRRTTGLTYLKESFDYIKNHPTEDYLICNGTTKNDRIDLDVKLQPGEKLGFVWHGNLGWRFTTPSLNTLPYTKELGKHPKGLTWPDDDAIGQTITKDGLDFTITQNVFGGALMHIIYEGKEYNVVGFENRIPGQTITDNGDYTGVYDGDFNDYMFLVETTPEYIAPVEELSGPDMATTITESGIWIFEDNYPNRGDYDFNDVVVSYEKKQTKSGEVEITCHLLACGCGFKNEFGLLVLDDINNNDAWKNPSKQQAVWKDINGNMNVGNEEVDLSKCKTVTLILQCKDIYHLQPYLDNGQGHGICTLQNYNTGDSPYILQIPNEQHCNFCWTREGVALTTAYAWGKARASDWYTNPLEEYFVVKIKK